MADYPQTLRRPDSWAVAKRFFLLFLPLLALLGVMVATFRCLDVRTGNMIVEGRELQKVDMQVETLADSLRSIVSDLHVLAGHREMTRALEDGETAGRESLAEEFLVLCEKKHLYDRIALLDESGAEIVRVDYNDGLPFIVSEGDLRTIENRDYFTEAMRVKPGQVHVSPFEPSVERGRIEEPLKPVIHFATPVVDHAHGKRGLVVLTYLGQNLIRELIRVSMDSPGKIMLLNSTGYWLHGPRREDEWGFAFEDRKDRTFGRLYPGVWKTMDEQEKGQTLNKDGLFTFAAIHPLAEIERRREPVSDALLPMEKKNLADDYTWWIVSYLPARALDAFSHRLFARPFLVFFGMAFFVAVICLALAHAGVRKRQAEEGFRAEKEFSESLIQSANEMIIAVDTERRITLFNRAAEKSFGYVAGEVVGKHVSLLYANPEESRFVHTQTIRQNVFTGEVVNRKKSGETFPAFLTASVMLGKDGAPIGVMGISLDISERKRMEAERENLARLKDEFVAIATHDLKAPLTAIMGFSGLLVNRMPPGSVMTEENHTFLEKTLHHSRVMQRIVEDFLDFHALEEGRLELEREPTDLNLIAREVVDGNTEYANGKRIRLAFEPAERLPEIQADHARIEQVIENFVNNAIKFGPEDSEVVVRTRAEDNAVVLEVSDTGPGLTDEDMAKVFSKYTRLSGRPTGKEKSTGLGLCISKKLIEGHNGQIGVRNNPGPGATFWFRLPA